MPGNAVGPYSMMVEGFMIFCWGFAESIAIDDTLRHFHTRGAAVDATT